MFLFLARIVNQLWRTRRNPGPLVKTKQGLLSYDVPFRCWPIDMDIFMHMNNASYVRVAELARWAVFERSKTLNLFAKSTLFLVVDQKITYLRPIGPFASYFVSTAVTFTDNKWIHYKHTFQSRPSNYVKEDPVVYAVVDVRAVIKERSGKTIRTDEFVKHSDFYQQMMDCNKNIADSE